MRKSLTQTVSLVLTVLDTFCIAVMALLFIILFGYLHSEVGSQI